MSESNLAQYQAKQLMTFASVMFVAIVGAIVASTYITMSLMRGEVAGAVAATQAQVNSANSCVDTEAVASRAAAAAIAANDNKHHEDAKPAGLGAAWGMTPHGHAVSHSNNVTNNTTNTDNSQWQLIDNTDNSKGKTTVTNNSTNNNTVNQNGLSNTNHQDLSNTQVVAPVNVIDNEYNKNSKNTDNSQKTVIKDSFNTDNSDNSTNIHDNKVKLELPVLY